MRSRQEFTGKWGKSGVLGRRVMLADPVNPVFCWQVQVLKLLLNLSENPAMTEGLLSVQVSILPTWFTNAHMQRLPTQFINAYMQRLTTQFIKADIQRLLTQFIKAHMQRLAT